MFERLAGADPTDVNAARTVAISRENLGDALRKSGGVTEALDLYRKALDAHRGVHGRRTPTTSGPDATRRGVAETLGDVLASAEAPGAVPAWRESQQRPAGRAGRHAPARRPTS